jgi:glycosyltransferase involved in cell wall biosynthesis
VSIIDVEKISQVQKLRPAVEASVEEPLRFRSPTTMKNTRFGFISTFPPTRCGLASFTDSLAVGLASLGTPMSHIVRACEATDAIPPMKNLPHALVVGDLIAQKSANPWLVNESLQDCDVVILQHEFGIFGGPDGDDIIPILESLEKPVIVVFHTILEWPTEHQKFVVERVANLSTLVVVMTTTAESFLLTSYDVDFRKVSLIPHGVPVPSNDTSADAVEPGTLLTWGLMGPGKGIEWGIMALALLQESHPNLTYTVVGQTHPKVFERDGDQYRDMLARLAGELGVMERVIFDDRYVDLDDLGTRIRQSDIVLLPYDARHQVTSGVLVEALAAGKRVVSTAFPHAVELLSDGAGLVVKHESPVDIANAIHTLMTQSSNSQRTDSVAPPQGMTNSWPQIAQQFLTLADTRISPELSGLK